MRKGIFYISFFLFFNSVNAQMKEPVIISSTPTKNISGLYIGVSSIEHNAHINGRKFSSFNYAFNLGLIFEKEFNDKIKLSLRPGLVLVDDIKNNFNIDNKNYSYAYPSLIYEIPLLFIYSIKSNKNFSGFPNYVQFGPVFSYNLANNSTYLNGSTRTIPSFASNYESNLKFGFGYDIKLKFFSFRPEFSYNLGFNSLKSNTLPGLNLSEIRNNQYSFLILISQRLNKVKYKKIEKTGSLPPLWKNIFRSAKKPKIF